MTTATDQQDRRTRAARDYWAKVAREQAALRRELEAAGDPPDVVEAALDRHQAWAMDVFARDNPIEH